MSENTEARAIVVGSASSSTVTSDMALATVGAVFGAKLTQSVVIGDPNNDWFGPKLTSVASTVDGHKETVAKLSQPLKASVPMESTNSGMVTDTSALQPLKA